MRSLSVAVSFVLVIAIGAWLWYSHGAQAAPDLTGANVLLVTIDTLRADRLAAYGGQEGLTPTLDFLAGNGVHFSHAWSHAPMTLPSHASILTGLLPPNHGVRNNGSYRLAPGPTTLGEQLKGSGYRTGAFVGAFVLDARFGLNRGFDEYDDRYSTGVPTVSFHFTERPANQVLRAATDWILLPANGAERPWFAWVHLFDPHAPYQAPPAFASSARPRSARPRADSRAH